MPVTTRFIDRKQALFTAHGLLYENFNYSEATTSIMISGRVYFLAVGLCGGDLVTNLHFNVTTAGVSNTLIRGAILTDAGVRAARTADLGNGWTVAGVKVVPLETPYTVPVDGLYYVAVLATGGTLPILARQGNMGTGGLALDPGGGTKIRGGTMSSQTDIPDPVTIAVGTAPLLYWVGLS